MYKGSLQVNSPPPLRGSWWIRNVGLDCFRNTRNMSRIICTRDPLGLKAPWSLLIWIGAPKTTQKGFYRFWFQGPRRAGFQKRCFVESSCLSGPFGPNRPPESPQPEGSGLEDAVPQPVAGGADFSKVCLTPYMRI